MFINACVLFPLADDVIKRSRQSDILTGRLKRIVPQASYTLLQAANTSCMEEIHSSIINSCTAMTVSFIN